MVQLWWLRQAGREEEEEEKEAEGGRERQYLQAVDEKWVVDVVAHDTLILPPAAL